MKIRLPPAYYDSAAARADVPSRAWVADAPNPSPHGPGAADSPGAQHCLALRSPCGQQGRDRIGASASATTCWRCPGGVSAVGVGGGLRRGRAGQGELVRQAADPPDLDSLIRESKMTLIYLINSLFLMICPFLLSLASELPGGPQVTTTTTSCIAVLWANRFCLHFYVYRFIGLSVFCVEFLEFIANKTLTD